MTDLYEVLGVPRDASQEDIRAAYRSKAKDAHPDSGGSDDAFSELGRAHLVLSDPVKRAKYDETGQFTDGPSTVDEAAFNLINGILQQALAGEGDPFKVDLIAAMRGLISTDLQQIETKRVPMVRARERTARLKGKFSGKRGPQFDRMLEWHRQQIEQQIALVDAAIAQRKRALELLEDTEFDWEKPPAPTVSTFADQGADPLWQWHPNPRFSGEWRGY